MYVLQEVTYRLRCLISHYECVAAMMGAVHSSAYTSFKTRRNQRRSREIAARATIKTTYIDLVKRERFTLSLYLVPLCHSASAGKPIRSERHGKIL